MADTLDVLSEVAEERARQGEHRGGLDREGVYAGVDWISLIDRFAYRATPHDLSSKEFRDAMIKIAALAVAAVEAHDRA